MHMLKQAKGQGATFDIISPQLLSVQTNKVAIVINAQSYQYDILDSQWPVCVEMWGESILVCSVHFFYAHHCLLLPNTDFTVSFYT